jgi:aromatic-L-amino-acid/L-tryptophan decarboxylase
MTPEEFERHGRAAVAWVAEYMRRVATLPVMSRVQPGEVRAKLPPSPPDAPEPFERVLRDLDEIILPGITHWQSPGFFGYFPANASGPAIIGEIISAGLGVQGMLWATSPACTELETHVLDWVAQMLELPAKFHSLAGPGGGVIQDTASSAALCALVAARERATRGETNERGADGALTCYASAEAHSSIEKAVKIAGLGRVNLRLIETDDRFAMRPALLAEAIEADVRAGMTPCFVCATVGTTSAGAIDPVPAIAEVSRDCGAWLHVDAAYAGAAAVCPEMRSIHEGLAEADSYCFNPHKWLLTNFDCDCFYVADRAALINALTVLPEYLRNAATESGAVIDYRDWQVPLGRRFRALKLWFVVRAYGVSGLREHIRRGVALAREFAGWVGKDDRFELAAEPLLSLVCFRHRGGDTVNERLLEAVNATGDAFLTHTRLRGRHTLRMAIGGTMTRREHVQRTWEIVQQNAP